jgi:hypothetical protein
MPKLTTTQNKALHLFLERWADVLNENGVTIPVLVKNLQSRGLEIPVTKTFLKEQVWKPVQSKMADIDSTQDMETTTPDDIHMALSNWSGSMFGVIAPPWPSIESLTEERENDSFL